MGIKQEGKIIDIQINDGGEEIMTILDEYCEEIVVIPTENAKSYFRDWNRIVPPKFVRQCIFAGIFFALKHPERIEVIREAI